MHAHAFELEVVVDGADEQVVGCPLSAAVVDRMESTRSCVAML